jgi:hypothetical protein
MDNHSLINTTRAKSNWKYIITGKTDDDDNGNTTFTNNYPASTDPSIKGCLINVNHLYYNPTEAEALNIDAVKIYIDGIGVQNIMTNEDLTNGDTINDIFNEPRSRKYRELNPSTCIGIFPLSHRGIAREGTQVQSRTGNPYTSGIWCSADIPSLTAFTVRIKPWTYSVEAEDANSEAGTGGLLGGVEEEPSFKPPHLAHIEIDGGNDYIELSNLAGGSEDVLDWSKDWSFGITLAGLTDTTGDAKQMCLIQKNGNAIYLSRGGTNWGVYISGDYGGYRHGANTWYRPASNGKLLFTYKASTQKLRYYIGTDDSTGYNLRATITPNGTLMTNRDTFLASSHDEASNNVLYIGKATSGSSTIHWEGGFNNAVISDIQLTGANINPFFVVGNDEATYINSSIYSDYTSYLPLGEGQYPHIVDRKDHCDGVLNDGTPDDYVIDQQDPPSNYGDTIHPFIVEHGGVHILTVANHPYTPALNGEYGSVGSYYRDPSPPRNFKTSTDHHLFRRDSETNTYLLFSYGIHDTATWYVAEYPLLGDEPIDYLNSNSTTLGQLNQHSIGTGWNDFSGGVGHYPTEAYTPSHSLTASFLSLPEAPITSPEQVGVPIQTWDVADTWENRQFGLELEVIQIRNEVKI